MKIEKLSIANFRGIAHATLIDLGAMVIIAGQNGSGKSCIFDALRLLKSIYGGYQPNEVQQWMGEFQIKLTNKPSDFLSMFNDLNRELRIRCEFRLSAAESKYISENADELLREGIWQSILPASPMPGGSQLSPMAANYRRHEPEVAARAKADRVRLLHELAAPTIVGECFMSPGGHWQVVESPTLAVAFSTFSPADIGVIDYHSAQRHYGREQVQGINLSLDANEQQRSHAALYNSAAKYNNVKGELAASYIKDLLAERAGVKAPGGATLTATLQELFATFFPDKEFLGPQPNASGLLAFPVKTSAGSVHDLDELSAGEKEILYGYLRIRNSAPRNSIILLDEPELHLNPRLIRGLPQFYKKNLGDSLGNQIWLVSHSDALLREVVGQEGYTVFHMLPCGKVAAGDSQLKPLSVSADLEFALLDLVGDLATYRPNGKVIIFEGGGDSDFDRTVTSMLFPELLEHANLVSATNKARVKSLHDTLEAASAKGHLPFTFFAITDMDSDTGAIPAGSVRAHTWDVYHIENYFLESKFILKVLSGLQLGLVSSEEQILADLKNAAREVIPKLVAHEVEEYANRKLVDCIKVSADITAPNLSDAVAEAVVRSAGRIEALRSDALLLSKLKEKEAEVRAKYSQSMADGTWIKSVSGRDILKRFVHTRAPTTKYETFRNLIIQQMRDASFQPMGMKSVIDKILAA